MRKPFTLASSIALLVFGGVPSVQLAQVLPSRTWVSSSGNDANACTRGAPCRTFAGALLKTAANGEIDVADPGEFGPVRINKAITIDGNGVGRISRPSEVAIQVIAGDQDVVVLRNLRINGLGTGISGVSVTNGSQTVIENCTISEFTVSAVGAGYPAGNAAQNLLIIGSTISDNNHPTRHVAAVQMNYGTATVKNSLIINNWFGLLAVYPGSINANSNILFGNTIAVYSDWNGLGEKPVIRLSNNDVYSNLTGFLCGGGTIATDGNNRKGDNTGGGLTSCGPDAVITRQ